MKRVIILPLLFGFSQLAYSSISLNANHKVYATIVKASKADTTKALDFGRIVVAGEGGTVTINLPNDKEVRTKQNSAGGTIELVGGSSEGSSGAIKLTGNGPVNIVLPTNQVTFKSASEPNDVYVSEFRSNATDNKLTLQDGKETVLNIGATLHLPKGTAIGDYSGTYPVKITYQ